MEDAELAAICLVPDRVLCGFHCFPPIITSILLHKQNAWNESRAVLARTENVKKFHHYQKARVIAK